MLDHEWDKRQKLLTQQIWNGGEDRQIACRQLEEVLYTGFLCNLRAFPEGGEYRRVAEIAIAALHWLGDPETREVVTINKPPFRYELGAKRSGAGGETVEGGEG